MTIHTLTFKTDLLRSNSLNLLEGIFYVDYEYIVKGSCFANTVTFLRYNVYQYLIGNSAQSVAAHNMVNRYLHHEAVVKELLAFEQKNPHFSPAIKAYLQRKIQLIIHTHYNILLIFDIKRSRGRRRATEFISWLKHNYPAYYTLTSQRRTTAWILHYLGVNAKRLDKLMGRR